MALVTYPLNNIEYSAEDAELFHVTRTSGIYANDSFNYSVSGADNAVVIGTGIGWIKNSEFSGKVIAQKESISLDMGLPDSVYPRIDAIVIQFDSNRNETNIVAKTGVASAMPVAPTVVRTESVYELHLYHVLREAGSLYITPSNITDLRLNSSYCGLMADSVTNIDTTAIEGQVSDLIKSLQNEISNVIDGSAYLLRNGSTNMTGNLPMDGHKVTGLGTPTEDGDAVPKKYIDNLSASDIGAAPVGLHRCYGSLQDIGITTFPTTMSAVANAMPSNSMIVIDTRKIVAGGAEEISDWGNESNGTAYINKGSNVARVTMAVIYGSGTSTKGRLFVGSWASIDNKVGWCDYGFDGNASYPGCFYRSVDGETEWINPPMVLGIEYRTAERWSGKVVYTKIVDAGNLPNSTSVSVAHGVSATQFIRYVGMDVTSGTSLTADTTVAIGKVNIAIKTTSNQSSKKACVQLWYVKD